jgi:hypothetical protein
MNKKTNYNIEAKEAMKEACRQTLELAANSDEYKPFITADDGTIAIHVEFCFFYSS